MGSTDNVLLLILYIPVFWGVAISPALLRPRNLQSIDPFEPYIGLTIILFFYSWSALIGFQVNGLTDDLEAVYPSSITKFGLACIVGQLGLAIGEVLTATRQSERGEVGSHLKQDTSGLESALVGPGLAIALILLPFYWGRFNFLSVESYADTALESRVVRMEDLNAGVKDVFLRDMPVTVVLCAATMILFDRQRLFVSRLVSGLAITAYLFTSLLSGARGVLASTAILPVVYFHYRVMPFSKVAVCVLGMTTYVAVNLISVARLSSDPVEMVQLVEQKIDDEGYGFLAIGQSSELRTSINLVRLIIGLDLGEDRLRLGGIAWANFASSVPRTFWPDRPLTGAEQFTQVFYPGALSAGAGYGSFIFQDPYWDFGFAGIFVLSLLYAMVLRGTYTALIANRGSGFWVLCYALVYGHLAVFVVRNGLYAGIKNSLIALIPMLLIALLARARNDQPFGAQSEVRK